MQTIQCAHCGQPITIEASMGGRYCCPHCDAEMVVGALPAVAKPPRAIQQVSPPVVIHNDHRAQPRLDAGGWFARSFAVTAGVVVAILAINVAICAGMLLIFGGFVGIAATGGATGAGIATIPQEPPQPTPPAVTEDRILTEARSFLAEHGYTSGVFFAETREEIDADFPDSTHAITGDIRTAISSVPFRISARVVPGFDAETITFERLIVGKTQVFP